MSFRHEREKEKQTTVVRRFPQHFFIQRTGSGEVFYRRTFFRSADIVDVVFEAGYANVDLITLTVEIRDQNGIEAKAFTIKPGQRLKMTDFRVKDFTTVSLFIRDGGESVEVGAIELYYTIREEHNA